MAYFDLSMDELKRYIPDREEPGDYGAFWGGTLQEASEYPIEAKFTPADFGLQTVETYDVSFRGFAGQEIKGWFILPKNREGKLPCVVEFIGYSGGRSFPTEWLLYPSAGYAYLVMDTRGQGFGRLNGETPDIADEGCPPQYPGFMTRGILNPKTYYYRRLMTDAVRAVEAARCHPVVMTDRIAVTGKSQGGGLSLAVAGLDLSVKVCMPDVPFLCHYRRAVELIDTSPYSEIVQFCKSHRDKAEQVFRTLAYFDGINFAARAKAKSLFSVGLRDDICPPSTVFAAYNHYAGEKDIRIYEFNQHDGGGPHQNLGRLKFLKSYL